MSSYSVLIGSDIMVQTVHTEENREQQSEMRPIKLLVQVLVLVSTCTKVIIVMFAVSRHGCNSSRTSQNKRSKAFKT